MIIILFGLPGSGKNHVSKLFAKFFNYHIFDADKDVVQTTKKIIKLRKLVSEHARKNIYHSISLKALSLEKKYANIVIPRTFTHERTRKTFRYQVPTAKFIYITAPKKLRYSRIQRRDHHIDLEYAKKFDSIFEKPKLQHYIIRNTKNGGTTLKKQIATILNNIEQTTRF
jgi:dephospho-CoA kinase